VGSFSEMFGTVEFAWRAKNGPKSRFLSMTVNGGLSDCDECDECELRGFEGGRGWC